MKKILAVLLVLAAVLATWTFWPGVPGGFAGAGNTPDSSGPDGDTAGAPAKGTVGENRNERQEVPTPAAEGAGNSGTSTGTVRVHCEWMSDHAPLPAATVYHYRVLGKRSIGPLAVEVSNVRGVATFPDLAPGEHLFQAGNQSRKTTVRAGETVEVKFTLAKLATLRGLVVDDRRQPVAGATVVYEKWEWQARSSQVLATTGGDGRFQVRVAWTGELWAEKPGWQPGYVHRIYEQPNQDLVLTLQPHGRLLTGVVLDPQGQPVAGATVAVPLDDKEEAEVEEGAATDANKERPPILVTTDAAGAFRSHGLPAGKCRVYAHKPGFAAGGAEVEVPESGGASVVVQLRAGATVHGTVRDADGKPLPRTMIEARPASPLPGLRRGYSEHLTRAITFADADGRFHLSGIHPGRMWLYAYFPRMVRNKNVALRDGETFEWNPDNAPSGRLAIRGRLVDPDGKALAGWRVHTSRIDMVEMQPESSSAITDTEGRFELQKLRDLPYNLTVHLPGTWVGAAYRKGVQPDRPEFVWQIPFRPEDCGTMSGRVLGPDGQPLANVRIGARQGDLGRGGRMVNDVPGGFRLEKMPPGTWSLVCHVPRQGSFDLGQHYVGPGATVDIGDQRLAAPGRVVLLPREGRFPPNVAMRLNQEKGRNETTDFKTASSGSLRSAPLPPGRYNLVVWAPDMALIRQQVTVESGRDTTVDLRPQPGTMVQFTFIARGLMDEQWKGWLQIYLHDAGGGQILRHVATVESKGRHTWKIGLAPGRYQVRGESWQPTRRQGQASFQVPSDRSKPVQVEVRLAVQ